MKNEMPKEFNNPKEEYRGTSLKRENSLRSKITQIEVVKKGNKTGKNKGCHHERVQPFI